MNNKNHHHHHQLFKFLFMPFVMMKRRHTMGCKQRTLSPSFKNLLMPFLSERSRRFSRFQAFRFWKIRWWIVESTKTVEREICHRHCTSSWTSKKYVGISMCCVCHWKIFNSAFALLNTQNSKDSKPEHTTLLHLE